MINQTMPCLIEEENDRGLIKYRHVANLREQIQRICHSINLYNINILIT